jgi:hypothetical protein
MTGKKQPFVARAKRPRIMAGTEARPTELRYAPRTPVYPDAAPANKFRGSQGDDCFYAPG